MPLDVPEIICLSPTLKRVLQQELEKLPDKLERKLFLKLIGEMASCPTGDVIGFENGSRTGRKKKKRAPSVYNIHMSNCMKGGRDFRSCVADWRIKRETGHDKRG